MTKLLLASQLTEARKFSRDDRLRSSTPGREAARLKVPALSRSWSLISFVVVHRSADGDRDITAQSALNGVTMKETVAQKHKGVTRLKEPELTPARQIAQCLTSAHLTFRPLSCERCVAGRDANRHAGGISRFQKRARISARCFSRRSPASHPVSRRGSGQGSHLGQGYC